MRSKYTRRTSGRRSASAAGDHPFSARAAGTGRPPTTILTGYFPRPPPHGVVVMRSSVIAFLVALIVAAPLRADEKAIDFGPLEAVAAAERNEAGIPGAAVAVVRGDRV